MDPLSNRGKESKVTKICVGGKRRDMSNIVGQGPMVPKRRWKNKKFKIKEDKVYNETTPDNMCRAYLWLLWFIATLKTYCDCLVTEDH